ncbi:O-antigen ligase family protein [Candidatus Puniceispirillum sp.]|nr:O-antigen ligase family protein [Candidatus Puniceispirillum sp.]
MTNLSINRNSLNFFCFFLFGCWFFTAGIFQIPGVDFEVFDAVLIKRSFTALTVFLMLSLINWRASKIRMGLYFLTAWIIIQIINFVYFGSLEIVFLRCVQAISVFSIVFFFGQNFNAFRHSVRRLDSIFLISALFFWMIVISYPFSTAVQMNLVNGFGGNRVNFSIWASQLVVFFAIMWVTGRLKFFQRFSNLILTLYVFVFPILMSQILSGGRLGVLVSFVSLAFVFYIRYRLTTKFLGALLTLIFVLSLGYFAESSYKLVYSVTSVNNSMLRGFSSSNNGNLFDFFNTISSQRVYLFIEGLKQLKFETLIFGNGIGNFTIVGKFGSHLDVHNVFLKTLGEVGVFGFIVVSFVVTSPVLMLNKKLDQSFIIFGLAVWLLPAMCQPEFYYTQIGSSLCFWVVFAAAYSGNLIPRPVVSK